MSPGQIDSGANSVDAKSTIVLTALYTTFTGTTARQINPE